MNCDIIMKLLNFLAVFHLFVAVNTSRVQDAKAQIRDEVRHAIGGPHRPPSRKEIAEIRHDIGHHHTLDQPRKWSHRRRLGTYFTPWTKWSACDPQCRQSRERYCRKRRKCGDTKHIEERKCYRCTPDHILPHPPVEIAHTTSIPHRIPVYEEIPKVEHEPDYYVVKKYKKKRKPIVIEVEDYEDLENEQDEDDNDMFSKKFNRRQVKSIRTKEWNGDFHQFDPDVADIFDSIITTGRKAMPQDSSLEYEDDANIKDFTGLDENDMEYDYDYDENKNASRASHREKAVFELPPRHRRVYSRWSKWTKCSTKCTTRRYKKCRLREFCGKEVLREIAYCYTEGSFCQAWVESQVHKTPPYELKPVPMSRKDVVTLNSVSNDFVLSGKAYRGPEYAPLKLKCGIPSVRNSRRNTIDNMLKIIGGKSARKGQWPWQVVIFNRFKEAFCGGTLIAPNWVLTAAHCVRKVLYVRIGEHNLDVKDESEIEMRVVKSIKHPNYDKKTVDSDVALLRLPKPVAATQFVGYACMPKPYQPLPKNIQCTVIGWGKRRNRDQAGTSILHQAEVPIISMENCKAVYQDYTITKNMFCAGHKRGRIDTCAGDSGGPLLCRDSTQPNHPWTIFGITSFGDGCAKKNKFGIYAKVPNYVDWAWSVVNCNGNCKPAPANRKLG